MSNKYTLILVAHRLSTVRKANHIYVLKDGHLIQNGDYTSLSKDDGVFKQLIHAQLVDEN